jgi:hypothetical protein
LRFVSENTSKTTLVELVEFVQLILCKNEDNQHDGEEKERRLVFPSTSIMNHAPEASVLWK